MGNTMELTRINQEKILVKTKAGSLVLGPGSRISLESAGETLDFSGPGEYEASGFAITGFKAGGYLIEAEDVSIGYLTDEAGEVDLLITRSWEAAQKLQPAWVVPVDEPAAADLIRASGLEAGRETKLVVSRPGRPEETKLVAIGQK